MKIKLITDKIIWINFKTQRNMCKTLLRFQEYYESPKFKDKIFSLNEFKEWYKKERGRFSYYSDWRGFNIPEYVLIPFIEGKFKNLTRKEIKLLSVIKKANLDPYKDIFYIICTYGVQHKSLKHEIAHALYYTNPQYRNKINLIFIENKQNLSELKEILLKYYNESVLYDELHAFLICGLSNSVFKNIDKEKYLSLIDKFTQVYDYHTINFKKDNKNGSN